MRFRRLMELATGGDPQEQQNCFGVGELCYLFINSKNARV